MINFSNEVLFVEMKELNDFPLCSGNANSYEQPKKLSKNCKYFTLSTFIAELSKTKTKYLYGEGSKLNFLQNKHSHCNGYFFGSNKEMFCDNCDAAIFPIVCSFRFQPSTIV